MSENNGMNLADLLDMDIDDLEDLKGFDPYKAGTHKVIVKWAAKSINDKKNYELTMTLVETVELDDAGDTNFQAPGFEGSVLFSAETEIGRGKLKALLLPMAEVYGVRNLPGIMEQMNNCEFLVRTAVRKNKNDPSAPGYTDVKQIAVV